jgi:hypothetical protein
MPQKKITPLCTGPVGELANSLAAILHDGGYVSWIARSLRRQNSRPDSPVMGGP